MRRLALLACCLALSACSDQGLNPIVGAMVDEVNPFDNPDGKPAAAGSPITRAAIDRANVATIRARLVTDESPTYMSAASDNGGFVTYASSLRQTLTLRGVQVTASRGLGWDLLSAKSSQPDPLVRPIPPGQWPAQVTRVYEFPEWAPRGRIETFECRYEMGAGKQVTILSQVHRGVEISEYCSGPTGEFENLHFVDGSGAVWRSLQWLGPEQGLVDVEVVLPYTGRK